MNVPPDTSSSFWFKVFSQSPAIADVITELDRGGDISLRGAVGSSTTILVAAMQRARPDFSPYVLVVPHLDDAEEAIAELVGLEIDAVGFPALEVMPGETNPSADLVSARLDLVRRMIEGRIPDVIVAPFPALMQGIPDRARLENIQKTIRPGDQLDVEVFLAWLSGSGWTRVDAVESPGEFAVRGGLLDVFPYGGAIPVRIDLFGDDVDRIHEIDTATQASDRSIPETVIIGTTEGLVDEKSVSIMSMLPEESTVVLAELSEIVEQGRGYWERVRDSKGVCGPPAVLKQLRDRCRAMVDVNEFSVANASNRVVTIPVRTLPAFDDELSRAMEQLESIAKVYPVALACSTTGEFERARELLSRVIDDQGRPIDRESADRITIEHRHVHRGFLHGEGDSPEGDSEDFAVVPFHELLNRWGVRRRAAKLRGASTRDEFLKFAPGDLVVHRDHGIARFEGLGLLPSEDGSSEEEVLTLAFNKNVNLHVPLGRIELVQRYVGAGGGRITLSTLGGKRWKRQKEQVEGAVKDLAGELLRVQAARAATLGISYPEDTLWQTEFEAEFPYEETDDQISAIAAVKHGMMQSTPMDRLICGDVGFGKTEVAIRAAFKAAEAGCQVAVLVPTTILAEQHERTFASRFRTYPFRIASLSRFKTPAERNEILEDLDAGKIDVIIGTHRLFSKDVRFKALGLIVIDEEQRFGVEHKQRLLQLRTTADVLTLSATPIPRTLHMAMLGIREISSLATAPLDRRAVVTEVIPFNERRIQQAIQREMARDGQIFFVHNRVHDIQGVADQIQKLVPDAKILIGHGQMPPQELERVMLAFVRKEADILVSTTIIESGVDISSANTMFVNDAHRFGLADLHQLRGRVGRSRHRAYCYMLLPGDRRINEDGRRRLKAVEDYSMLGAGFRIAMRDLEIRGAGNLLGPEQSGHITTVGYDMYCRMLEDAVGDLKNIVRLEPGDTIFDIGLKGSIPRGYIPSDQRRMEAHRRIAQARGFDALDKVRTDLQGAYGDLPKAVDRLLEIAEIRLASAILGVRSVLVKGPDLIFKTSDALALEGALKGVKGTVRVVGERDTNGEIHIYYRPPGSYLKPSSLAAILRKRLLPAARAR